MKNLLSTPSHKAGPVRLADKLELLALEPPRWRASESDLIASLDRREDEDEDLLERPVQEAFYELEIRQRHLGQYAAYYPFRLERTSLVFERDKLTDRGLLYLFLLFATNLNMRDERKHAGLDGAALFEHLSCEVARNFWGGRRKSQLDARVDALVFGTSRSQLASWDAEEIEKLNFEGAVNALCKRMGEGGYFRPKSSDPVHAQDDRVDFVVWRLFSDFRAGRLIAFGQCKTGTHWRLELPRLRPDSFCRKWLDHFPATTPLALFFLSDRVAGSLINECYDCGILFDRCRVLDYADDLPLALVASCGKWTRAVLKKHGLG